MSLSVTGLLIQAVTGILGARGRRVNARVRGAGGHSGRPGVCPGSRARCADVHRVRGVQRYPGMPVLVVVIGEEHAAERARASCSDPNVREKPGGLLLSVFNCASLYGLSLLTFGRECD